METIEGTLGNAAIVPLQTIAEIAPAPNLLAAVIDGPIQAGGGGESPPTMLANDSPETVALAEALKIQWAHAAIAGMERQDFGVARMGGGIVPFGRGVQSTPRFFSLVKSCGALAFVARNYHDVLYELSTICGTERLPRNSNTETRHEQVQ